ncbi:hypothetical protein Save01_07648 [Streptomyces avermitilis]
MPLDCRRRTPEAVGLTSVLSAEGAAAVTAVVVDLRDV